MLIQETFLCSIVLSILNAIFYSLYVERLPTLGPDDSVDAASLYFLLCQLLYALWFGLKDVSLFYHWTASIFRDDLRIRPLMYCGPLLALCFVFLWAPVTSSFASSSLHFTVMMIIYTELHATCAAALPTGQRAESASAVISGACAGLACYLYAWDGDLPLFLFFTTTCAFAAAVVFLLFGESVEAPPRAESPRAEPVSSAAAADPAHFRRFVAQTWSRDAARAAAVLWALHGFGGVVLAMAFHALLRRGGALVSAEARAALVGAVCVAPRLLGPAAEAVARPLAGRRRVCALLAARAIVGATAVALAAGADDMDAHTASTGFAVLVILARVLSDAVERLQVQIVRDIADEDAVIFGRAKPMTLEVRRFLTAVSSPFQALALVVVFRDFTAGGGLKESAWLCGWTGVATSLPVLLVWRQLYNLYGEHLQFVHMAMKKRLDVESACV